MNKYTKTAIAPLILILCSCSSSTSSVTENIKVVTISGKTISLDGVYESCDNQNTTPDTSERYTLYFAESTMAIEQSTHFSIDCTGTTDGDDFFISTNISQAQTSSIIGWVDNYGETSKSPLAIDGTGSLSGSESITLINATITESNTIEDVGLAFEIFFVVDDTGDKPMLYQDDDDVTTGRFAVSNTPVPKL